MCSNFHRAPKRLPSSFRSQSASGRQPPSSTWISSIFLRWELRLTKNGSKWRSGILWRPLSRRETAESLLCCIESIWWFLWTSMTDQKDFLVSSALDDQNSMNPQKTRKEESKPQGRQINWIYHEAVFFEWFEELSPKWVHGELRAREVRVPDRLSLLSCHFFPVQRREFFFFCGNLVSLFLEASPQPFFQCFLVLESRMIVWLEDVWETGLGFIG